MADADTSAELHPPADVDSDSTAAPIPPADPQRRGGRPRAPVSGDPEIEARRAADRERKKRALQKKKGAPAAAGAGRRSKGANEAADANQAGAERRRDRGAGDDDSPSPKGWLRTLMDGDKTAEDGTGRSVTQLRHLALRVLELDGLAVAQEILADPRAKKTDKLRALDIVVKLSAGYVNPDLAGGEDVPDLPAPIFTTTDGQLPGEGIVTDENMSLGAEDDAAQDTGGPQLAPAAGAGGGGGPIPHVA